MIACSGKTVTPADAEQLLGLLLKGLLREKLIRQWTQGKLRQHLSSDSEQSDALFPPDLETDSVAPDLLLQLLARADRSKHLSDEWMQQQQAHADMESGMDSERRDSLRPLGTRRGSKNLSDMILSSSNQVQQKAWNGSLADPGLYNLISGSSHFSN